MNVAATNAGWHGIFGLINEHEGRLIVLVQQTTVELRDRLEKLDAKELNALIDFAREKLSVVRETLNKLRDLSNQILGLAGSDGLLELTAGGTAPAPNLAVLFNRGNLTMSNDRYEVGQAGAVGPGAQASNISFTQVWNKASSEVDVKQLAEELIALRTALASRASSPDDFVSLGNVAAAEKAAVIGDGPKALEHLKGAGSWVWEVASKVGIGVATAAAKNALGI